MTDDPKQNGLPQVTTTQSDRVVNHEFLRRRNVWNHSKFAWWIGHYILGSLATILPIADALLAPPDSHSTRLHQWLEIGGATCAALLTFLIPSRAGKKFGSAWRLLDGAIITYQVNSSVAEQTLIDALKEGEKIIDEADIG